MTIQKRAARVEMPFASILNSLLPRVRSRSRAFVVRVSMMKYDRVASVGHLFHFFSLSLSLSFLSFYGKIRKRELGNAFRLPLIDRDFSTRQIVLVIRLDNRCDGMESLVRRSIDQFD